MDTVTDAPSVIVETKPVARMSGVASSERWTTIQAAAPLIGRSEKTIRRWIAADRIAAQRGPDGRWLVRVEDGDMDSRVSTARTIGPSDERRTARALRDLLEAGVLDDRKRARRWAVAGWTLAAVSILVAVGGGVWLGTTRASMTERAQDGRRQAEQRVAELRARVEAAQSRAAEDRLLLAELRGELSRMAEALTATTARLAEATTCAGPADERGSETGSR